MKRLLTPGLVSLLILGSLSSYAAKAASTLPPNLMPCDQVVKISSTEFVDKYTQVHGDNTLERVDAIYRYSACYDQSLDALRDKMNQSGRHPLMGANANFRDFELALNKFTATALAVCSPEGSLKRITDAYATLYQKQFRRQFYQQYQPKGSIPPANPKAISAAKAKLDDLLKHLPKNQVEPVTKAFAAYYQTGVTVLGLPQQSVYEYAIMLLQSPADKPYSAPPF